MSRTVVASTVSMEHSASYIMKLFAGQVGLHFYNNFNLILENDDGLMYSSTETFEGLMPYLERYYKNGWINTDGVKFDKYIKRVFKKYITDFPDRPAYLIYVCGKKRRGYKGENKIVGIKNMKPIIDAGRDVLVSMLEPETFKDFNPDTQAQIFRSLLGL